MKAHLSVFSVLMFDVLLGGVCLEPRQLTTSWKKKFKASISAEAYRMCYHIKYVFINKNKFKMRVVFNLQGNSKLCLNNLHEFMT